jgi:hypothetical protein
LENRQEKSTINLNGGIDLHSNKEKPETDHGFLLSSVHRLLRDNDRSGMPRHARIVAAGFPLHVILRGIDRTAIFFAEDDYRVFPKTLAALAECESVRVHAYVLMTNHVRNSLREATDGGFVPGSRRFQQQIATMVGRRTWPGTSGRPRKAPADTDQLELPI